MEKRLVPISKFLSKVLRHDPQSIGLTLDGQGWARVEDILLLADIAITRADVEAVAARNEKQRFALSEDGQFIRANQGHSVAVDLGLQPKAPPEQLFHGTTFSSLPSIKQEGLRPMKRQHVHLSADPATARAVGQRHGKPVVLTIEAGHLHRVGQRFFVSENGVWLTDAVAPDHIGFPSASGEV